MNENNNTSCQHDNRVVTGGVVRCTDCHEFFHDHPDSDPRPGMVEENQFR